MNHALFNTFNSLHQQAQPLLLPNIWDAASAMLVQTDGAKAIATSSAAMAWSLGYADGSALPEAELLAAIGRIVRIAQVPVTVDLEDGYSNDPAAAAQLALKVVRWGVVGINLEDGVGPPELLVQKIMAIRKALDGLPLFINARTDVVLKNLAQGEAAIAQCINRLNAYRTAGADGAFIPGVAKADDAAQIVQAVDMPLNLMTVPGLDPIAALVAAGVKRVSAGPTLFQTSYGWGRAQAVNFLSNADISGLFANALPGAVMNAAMKSVV
jgi:2-methylisocitrate lyase-like PEP mutase family enzyme